MSRASSATIQIRLDRSSKTPLWRQLSSGILKKIEAKQLVAGDRLPAIRAMALSHAVSVDTVKRALEELQNLKAVVAHERSCFLISSPTPMQSAGTHNARKPRQAASSLRPQNEKAFYAKALYENWKPRIMQSRPFMPYVPAMNAVLDKEWLKIASAVARSTWHNSFYGDPAGLPSLRKAVAERFRLRFGIEVDPANVIVTTGTVQAIALCANILFEPGESIWVEAPSSKSFADLLPFWGLKALPVPVDEQGFCIESAEKQFPQARGAFVTTASQMPLSVPLSDSRREALVAWANSSRSYIIEDAAGSDFSLDGLPHPPLLGIPAAEQCTICIMSFSMEFYPDLKVACMIVPSSLAQAFAGAKLMFDRSTSFRAQEILARFFASDACASYERRIVRRFRANFQALRAAAEEMLQPYGRIADTRCGGHTAFLLNPSIHDTTVSHLLAAAGISALPISRYWGAKKCHNGLLLGFGPFSQAEIRGGIAAIAESCEKVVRSKNASRR